MDLLRYKVAVRLEARAYMLDQGFIVSSRAYIVGDCMQQALFVEHPGYDDTIIVTDIDGMDALAALVHIGCRYKMDKMDMWTVLMRGVP